MKGETYEDKFHKVIENLKKGKLISFREAIYYKCLDCMCYQPEEVKQCIDDECINYYYCDKIEHNAKKGKAIINSMKDDRKKKA